MGFGSPKERESFIKKEKMRTENGFPERERESFIRERKRELYQKRKRAV